jgi:regulator of sigma E protease
LLPTTILATIFVFGLLILFHELGHFMAAKSVNMKVTEFAIGFGPKLFSRKYGETVYSLRAIPLGGFNKIYGMDPDEEQDDRSFNAKPIWARMLVIIAGSTMNFVLPIIIFIIIYLSAGIETPSNQPILGNIFQDKPAYQAGLQTGDRIVSVNKQSIEDWRQFVSIIQANAGNRLEITYERGGVQHAVYIQPEFDPRANRGIIGVAPEILIHKPGFVESVTLAIKHTYLITSNMVSGIAQMITGKVEADVSGPIGVAQMAGQVAQLGILPLLQFAAFLSINLGLINLLPVPVLDGGHVVTLAIEGLRRKPLGRQSMHVIQMIGFILLMMLMIMATFKDVSRLKLF